MPAVQVKNDVVDIDVPTDEDAKQCARLLRDAHPPELKSVDLRRGVVTSAGAGIIAKGLKGKRESVRHCERCLCVLVRWFRARWRG